MFSRSKSDGMNSEYVKCFTIPAKPRKCIILFFSILDGSHNAGYGRGNRTAVFDIGPAVHKSCREARNRILAHKFPPAATSTILD